MQKALKKTSLSFAFLALSLCACGTPLVGLSRLETPEVSGPGKPGRIEGLAARQAFALNGQAQTVGTAETGFSQRLGPSSVVLSTGASLAVSSELDVTLRIQPGAPLLLLGKWQLAGLPESRAGADNFSVAVQGGGGIGLNGSLSVFEFQGTLLTGYRLTPEHLVIANLFFTSASLSSASTSFALSAYGPSLGYHYRFAPYFLRVEGSYVMGSRGSDSLLSPLFGVTWGIEL